LVFNSIGVLPFLVRCNHFVYGFFQPFPIEAGTLDSPMMILEIIFFLFMVKLLWFSAFDGSGLSSLSEKHYGNKI